MSRHVLIAEYCWEPGCFLCFHSWCLFMSSLSELWGNYLHGSSSKMLLFCFVEFVACLNLGVSVAWPSQAHIAFCQPGLTGRCMCHGMWRPSHYSALPTILKPLLDPSRCSILSFGANSLSLGPYYAVHWPKWKLGQCILSMICPVAQKLMRASAQTSLLPNRSLRFRLWQVAMLSAPSQVQWEYPPVAMLQRSWNTLFNLPNTSESNNTPSIEYIVDMVLPVSSTCILVTQVRGNAHSLM